MEPGEKKYAIAPEGCMEWLTPGKSYEVTRETDSGFGFYIRDDVGDELYCLSRMTCGHARGWWTFKTGAAISLAEQEEDNAPDHG